VDAPPFEGQQMVAALGIGYDGAKTIPGIGRGATGNATVVGELPGDLMNRGFDFTAPRLYVLDGGKALHAAVKKYAGEAAQCPGPLDGREQTACDQEIECGLRDGGLCGGQARARWLTPRVDASESERGAQFGRRPGGNVDELLFWFCFGFPRSTLIRNVEWRILLDGSSTGC